MTMNKEFWKIPWLSADEKARLHILYIACIRFVVTKHGGNMAVDSRLRIASIKIPRSHTMACYRELRQLNLVKPDQPSAQQGVSA